MLTYLFVELLKMLFIDKPELFTAMKSDENLADST